MATVAPVNRDDNTPVFIRCINCGFEVPHASAAGRGNAGIDMEEWLSLCQHIEAAKGRPLQCPELTTAQDWPISPAAVELSQQEVLMTAEPVLVNFKEEELSKLDQWIAQSPEPRPSRPEAIRRLVEDGLRARSEKLVTF